MMAGNLIVPGLVSTIIPVRNRPDLLKEAVESVLAQTYRPIEIVISDDGSTDETITVARSFERMRPTEIRLVTGPHFGRGPGPVRERGRLAARGEFIQYLDSDDLISPSKFEVQVKALMERPECGVAYCWTRFCPADGPPETVPFKWTGRTFEELFPALLVDRWWSTNTPLYRRTVTDMVGPWTDIRWGQDWAYDARVAAKRVKLAYCPQFLCDWRAHHGVRQTSEADQFTYERLWEYHRLQAVLFEAACEAEISPGTREMLHFSRVEFMIARGFAALNKPHEAAECLALARRAAGMEKGNSLEYRVFVLGTRVLGWNAVGKLSAWWDSVRPRRKGRYSLDWSWSRRDPTVR